MKVLSIALISICCVASNVFVSADGDPSTGGDDEAAEIAELTKQLKELVDPYAPCELQSINQASIDLNNAITANDLCAATDILKSVPNLVKKILPKITALPYLHQAYINILIVNIKLNKQLACNKADMDDVAASYEFDKNQLEEAVCKELKSANGH